MGKSEEIIMLDERIEVITIDDEPAKMSLETITILDDASSHSHIDTTNNSSKNLGNDTKVFIVISDDEDCVEKCQKVHVINSKDEIITIDDAVESTSTKKDEGFVKIFCGNEVGDESALGVPCEVDGTIFLSTLTSQLPKACGLKYKAPMNDIYCAIKLCDGKLYPPATHGWDHNLKFECVYDHSIKRPLENALQPESKRRKKRLACSDLVCLGLSPNCTESYLMAYFKKYGEIDMLSMKNKNKIRFRGFAFVRFKDYSAQMRVLSEKHNINGRWVHVKVTKSGEHRVPELPCKVYIGRVTKEITVTDIKSYFSQFGDITNVYIPMPFRFCAFVTFQDPGVAQSLYGEAHEIKNHTVVVWSAASKKITQPILRYPVNNNRFVRPFIANNAVSYRSTNVVNGYLGQSVTNSLNTSFIPQNMSLYNSQYGQ